MTLSAAVLLLQCWWVAFAAQLPSSRVVRSESIDAEKLATSEPNTVWTPDEIVAFMDSHPQRAYFSRLFRDGGFRNGMEVGVAAGRFSEHVLKDANRSFTWHMVEPFPNKGLVSRYPPAAQGGQVPAAKDSDASITTPWSNRDIGALTNKLFYRSFSTDKEFLAKVPSASLDFVYLDGAHDYENVKQELRDFWPLVRENGVIAGHDYCNYGEQGLACKGCEAVPLCGKYTQWAVKNNHKPRGQTVANEAGVVRAVHEFLTESHPELLLHHTLENFTRKSLAADNIDYDLIITSTRNPSWYFFKQTRQAS